MNALSFLNPHAAALVWGVNVVLQITVVMSLALVVGSCLQRNAVARHGVLFSALLLVLIIPFSAAVSQHVGFGTFSVALFAERSAAADSGANRPTRRAQNRITASASEADVEISESSDERRRVQKLEHAQSATVGGLSLSELISITMPAFLGIWFVGTSLLLARLCFASRGLAAVLRKTKPMPVKPFEKVISAALRAVGMSTPPPIVISASVTSPMVAGIWRPKVVLPDGLLDQMTSNELCQILIHEMAHFVRRDQVVAVLQGITAAAFWFHPLIWSLNRQLACAREEICDNYVLSSTERPSYSLMLLRVAESIEGDRPLPVTVGLFTSRWTLEDRVSGILDERRRIMTRLTIRGFVCVLVLSLMLAAFGSVATIAPATGSEDDQATEPDKDSAHEPPVNKPDVKLGTPIPFRVRSRQFQGEDDLIVESFVELDSKESPFRYEVRGRYRLRSRPEARLAQYCANGNLQGTRGIRVKRGEGEFRFKYWVVKSGYLHISYYPNEGGSSFGSIYYDPTQGPLREDPQSSATNKPDAKLETPIPFRVRSREFLGRDDVIIESFVELDPKQSPFRYEVRGRYRLQSRSEAQLAQWCANGTLQGDREIQVQRGEGEFRFRYTVLKNGYLHISYYPKDGGNGFGSIYYDPTQGPLREDPQASRSRKSSRK